jgi:hypothetical protein
MRLMPYLRSSSTTFHRISFSMFSAIFSFLISILYSTSSSSLTILYITAVPKDMVYHGGFSFRRSYSMMLNLCKTIHVLKHLYLICTILFYILKYL